MQLTTLKSIVIKASRYAKKTNPHAKFFINDEEVILEHVLQYQVVPDLKFIFKKKVNLKKIKEN